MGDSVGDDELEDDIREGREVGDEMEDNVGENRAVGDEVVDGVKGNVEDDVEVDRVGDDELVELDDDPVGLGG